MPVLLHTFNVITVLKGVQSESNIFIYIHYSISVLQLLYYTYNYYGLSYALKSVIDNINKDPYAGLITIYLIVIFVACLKDFIQCSHYSSEGYEYKDDIDENFYILKND
ncbi:hypothetical protein C2G38_2094170 [Gigaspora rosea]|uniref:Uncharacterized protein n=1 Tax=Gigaspora rosea TaxID=44941 RepID=A0A397V221_9GLOM|nr:hypothetical protein C2G38_2094170 [Gigaspora rosea]